MGGFRATPFVLACVLPLSVAAQEPDRGRSGPRACDRRRRGPEGGDPEDPRREPDSRRLGRAGGERPDDLVRRRRDGGRRRRRRGDGEPPVPDRIHLEELHGPRGAATRQKAAYSISTPPVRELAPEVEFTNAWEETHPVHRGMVMEHTAGFDDIHSASTRKWTIGHDPGGRSGLQPGAHASAAGAGHAHVVLQLRPAIAAYVVEKITGKAFETTSASTCSRRSAWTTRPSVSRGTRPCWRRATRRTGCARRLPTTSSSDPREE